MANDNNIQTFTAFDIEKYHKGLLSPKERHALEKAALDDPFLADALEGYTANVNVAADLAELQKRLQEKTETAKVIPISGAKGSGSSFRLLRIAAIIIIVLGAGFMAYQFAFNKKDEASLAKTEPKEQTQTTTQQTTTNTTANGTQTDSNTATAASNNPSVKEQPAKGSSQATITTQPATATPQSNRQEDKITQEVSSPPVVAETNEKKENNNVTVAPSSGWTNPAKTLEQDKDALAKKRKEQLEEAKEAEYSARQYKYEQNSRTRVSAPVAGNNSNRGITDNNYYRNMNTFRGRVLDASNNGVPFANVTNIQDNVGTYTDARGYFNLTSTDSILNVQVRSVGLENRNVELQNSASNNQIVLQEDQSVATQTISTKKINAEKRQLTSTMKLEEPEPVDGWENYDSYLSNNLNVPDDFKTKQTGSGQVEVSFEVNKYGEPVNFKVEKSLCSRCDQEAIRLIKEGPKWKRKAKKGRTTVTISF